MNNVSLSGVLPNDPKVYPPKEGGKSAFARFTVKTTRIFTGRDGEAKTFNDYVDCQAWGNAAQDLNDLSEGTHIEVRGRISKNKIVKEGEEDRWVTSVSAEDVQVIPHLSAVASPQGEASTTVANDELPF